MADADKPKKTHKKKQSGVKSKKKKDKKNEGEKVDRHNPKANSFSGGKNSVRKRVQYQLDRSIRKDRAPKLDKTPDQPAPFVVVVQGPPGVGKTTLVKSLVKHYCKQRLLELRGPITLVSGRQRRLTIVECPREMSAMLDLSKVADLVLLLIDASFGFELETFEFINIMQTHGFPRVIGVLTHLDGFQDNKQLRKIKKTMKHRFWTEIYEGAKLFYLSGLQYGRYNRLEIQNLARFIAVQKNPILSWRTAHPYTLGLRWEDQTPPALPPSHPRVLDIYGYVYGGRLREGSQVHLPGAGDFTVVQVKSLTDPCPPPAEVDADKKPKQGQDGKPRKTNALRTLAERHRVIYAPGSDVGSISLDDDAMYIQVAEHQVGFTQREGEKVEDYQIPEAVRMVRHLQGAQQSLDGSARNRPDLRLVGRAKVRMPADEPKIATAPERRRNVPAGDVPLELDDDDDDEEGEEEEDGAPDMAASDNDMRKRVMEMARQRFDVAPRLETLIYGSTAGQTATEDNRNDQQAVSGPTDHQTMPLFDDADGEDGEQSGHITQTRGLMGEVGDSGALDTSRMLALPGVTEKDWDDKKKEDVKSRKFITGGWDSADEGSDAEGEKNKQEHERDNLQEGQELETAISNDSKKEIKSSESFADGFAISSFVRIRLDNVPAAFVAEMRRERPLLLGGLLPGETQMGMVQMRIKRHRWHPKLLKSGDALLMSMGWRRFQTVPTFSLEDRGEKRMRYLKYSLEHAHCVMTTHAPMVPPNTGIAAFRSWKSVANFRVSATGVVLETAPNFELKKKLKLTGEPYKIFKNTAFIKSMFNSDLEVNKYLHTKLQTVSGIRGEVKKAEGTKGHFRATFEDRILASDVVVCKCWINVAPRKFYHPVVDVTGWKAARLIGELRADQGIPVPNLKDSLYGAQVVRSERKFNTLKRPKALEAALPYKTKHKLDEKKKVSELRKKTAIVSSEHDRELNSLIMRLHTVKHEKRRLKHESLQKKKETKEKREQFIADKRLQHSKDNRKKRHIKEGMQETKKRKAMALE